MAALILFIFLILFLVALWFAVGVAIIYYAERFLIQEGDLDWYSLVVLSRYGPFILVPILGDWWKEKATPFLQEKTVKTSKPNRPL